MNPLFGGQGSLYASGPPQLELIVKLYVTAYLALLLVVVVGLALSSLLAAASEGHEDLPPDDQRWDPGKPGPRPPHASRTASASLDQPAGVTIEIEADS